MATTGSPTADLGGVAERQRLESHGAGVDLDDGDVAADVDADELALDALRLGAALVEDDGDAAGLLAVLVDDVGVGEDVAVVVDDEAGAERLAALRLAELVGAGAGEVGEHHDDAAREVLVDLLGRLAVAGRRRVDGRRLGGPLHDRLLDLAEVEHQHEDEDHERGADGAAPEPDEEPSHLHHCFPFVVTAGGCGGGAARSRAPLSRCPR